MSLVGLTVLALSTSTPALTSNVKLCFKAAVVYDDAARNALDDDTIEDNWANGSSQTLYGSRIIATSASATIFDGYLGDGLGTGDPGAGCTPSVPVSHPTQFFSVNYTIYSRGTIQGNELNVQNADNGNSGTSFSGTLYYSCAGGGCNLSTTVTIAPSGAMPVAMWQVYAADAYSLYRHAGGLTSSIFTVRLSSGENYDSEYNRNTGIISIRRVDAEERFTDSHELGHRIAHLRGLPTGDCSHDGQCPSVSGSHSMGSEEFQSCSFSEGFAHFYAADVWNSHYQQDCVFQYYKHASLPAVDCEASPSDRSNPVDFPLAMLETCGGDINDHGVEVDWLRTFWDVHTNGTSPPTFNDMMNWMHNAFVINLSPPFDELDYEANITGGTLNQNWDGAANGNGINH